MSSINSIKHCLFMWCIRCYTRLLFTCIVPRFAPIITRGMESMAAVNIRRLAQVCISASTSYRMTVSLERLAKGLTPSMQMLRKSWMAEESDRKTDVTCTRYTGTDYWSVLLKRDLSGRENQQVKWVTVFLCVLFKDHVYSQTAGNKQSECK